jgi:ribosomal protein S18 acetylase RimI-like enzyme
VKKMTVQVGRLAEERRSEAIRVLARAFASNPLHISAFGSSLARNEAFFHVGLSAFKGPKFVAISDSTIVGFIHWVDSPHCQFSAVEKLRMMPGMVNHFGLRSALKVGSWLSAWGKQDCAEPHSHLGPIGVAPEEQGRSIGQQLMALYCETLDQDHKVGYLETDKAGNVDFYKRFGFHVTSTITVLGVPNFFMRRPRTTATTADRYPSMAHVNG